MRRATVPDEQWLADIGPVDGIELSVWDMSIPLTETSWGAEVGYAVHPYLTPPNRVANAAGGAPGVTVQLLTAGYDAHLAHLPAGVSMCNAAGVHDTATAELAVTLLLASVRGIPEFVAAQARGEWLPIRIWPSLADSRVLILGYGRIGQAIARRLAPFEVALTAVATTRRPGDEWVGEVWGVADLPTLLPNTDVVIAILPLTDHTQGLIDAEFLAALPDGATLINVARGPVVNTDALLAELNSGRLRAAADVTDPEPLPADHPLWSAPNMLISPHVGGATDAFRPRAVRLIREQLRRYAAGQEFVHVVASG
jgi:phosphoglycerate dehydrogenase-like enzyme